MARHNDPYGELDDSDEFELTPEEQAALAAALGQTPKTSTSAMPSAAGSQAGQDDDAVYLDMQRRYKQLQAQLDAIDKQMVGADAGARYMLNSERETVQNQLTNLGRSLDVMRQRRLPRAAAPKEPSLMNLDPANPHIYERQADGSILQKPNPAYDPVAAAAKAARAVPQDRAARDEATKLNAAASWLRAQVASGKFTADEAQRQLDNYRKAVEAETKAREAELKSMLDNYTLRANFGASIGSDTVSAWRDALPYMAPVGTAEQIAAIGDAFRTGQLPEIKPLSMPFPYDPNTVAQKAAFAAMGRLPEGTTFKAPVPPPQDKQSVRMPEGVTFAAPPLPDWLKRQFEALGTGG